MLNNSVESNPNILSKKIFIKEIIYREKVPFKGIFNHFALERKRCTLYLGIYWLKRLTNNSLIFIDTVTGYGDILNGSNCPVCQLPPVSSICRKYFHDIN